MNLEKFVIVKSKNRRVNVLWYTDGDNHSIVIETKRLLDFKKRQITTVRANFGVETFLIMLESMTLLSIDPDFKKATNRIAGQLSKNLGVGETNCIR